MVAPDKEFTLIVIQSKNDKKDDENWIYKIIYFHYHFFKYDLLNVNMLPTKNYHYLFLRYN